MNKVQYAEIVFQAKKVEWKKIVLGGETEHHLSLGCKHGFLED